MPKTSRQTKASVALESEVIEQKIYLIRGRKVMLDSDLAELYNVPTKRLNEQVRRNLKRFPSDFMFQVTPEEAEFLRSHFSTLNNADTLRSQIATSSWGGRRTLPYVFTEQGVSMLSSVLNSERAIQVNIQIMRTFSKIRQMLEAHKELRQKIEALEQKYDLHFKIVFDALKQLLEPPPEPEKPRKRMGFVTD